MKTTTSLFFIFWIFISCVERRDEPKDSETGHTQERPISLYERMNGLWSLDSSGFLTNNGFLLQEDGSAIAVARNSIGSWSIEDSTILVITWSDSTEQSDRFRFVKMDTDRMTLIVDGTERLFRSVPFGLNNQPQVLSGFAGNLNSMRPERDYQLMLPSSKLIELNLESDDARIGFEVFEKERRICNGRTRSWKGVIIDPTGIRLRVSHTAPASLNKDGFDYDLKVMGY